MELLLLFVLTLPFIFVFLVFQSLFVLINSEDFKVKDFKQELDLELKLIKKIKKEDTNPLSIAALASPMTLPLFFVWPKDESLALVFEDNVSIAVKEKDFDQYEINKSYKIIKVTTRSFYKRKWFEKPILLNLFLQENGFKDEYETTNIKHRLA